MRIINSSFITSTLSNPSSSATESSVATDIPGGPPDVHIAHLASIIVAPAVGGTGLTVGLLHFFTKQAKKRWGYGSEWHRVHEEIYWARWLDGMQWQYGGSEFWHNELIKKHQAIFDERQILFEMGRGAQVLSDTQRYAIEDLERGTKNGIWSGEV